MIIGVGNDILDIDRIERELGTADPAFRDQMFSPEEIRYCESKRYPARHYAARFAAKEALFKALGTGLGNGCRWREVEVRHGPHGEPELILGGETLRIARQRGVGRTLLALTHTADLAMASVILEGPAAPAANGMQQDE